MTYLNFFKFIFPSHTEPQQKEPRVGDPWTRPTGDALKQFSFRSCLVEAWPVVRSLPPSLPPFRGRTTFVSMPSWDFVLHDLKTHTCNTLIPLLPVQQSVIGEKKVNFVFCTDYFSLMRPCTFISIANPLSVLCSDITQLPQ